MRRTDLNRLFVGLLLATSSAFVACAEEGSSAPPPATPPTASAAEVPTASPEDDQSSADLGEHHRHHHHGGVTMFIAMSLDSLGVSKDQAAAIEKIQGDLFAKMEPAHVAEQNVLNVLADGIAAGTIDGAKVDTAIDGVKAASAGLHEATIDALNQLHAALTPEQRAALVDKVEAHWEVWKKSNGEQEKVGDKPGHLEWLAKDLNLAPDQVEKIRTTFADRVKNHPQKFDPTQVEAHLQEFGTAFKADTFDAKTLLRRQFVNEHLAVWGARRMAHFYQAVDPLLTADQRTKLSAQLKAHATAKSGILDENNQER